MLFDHVEGDYDDGGGGGGGWGGVGCVWGGRGKGRGSAQEEKKKKKWRQKNKQVCKQEETCLSTSIVQHLHKHRMIDRRGAHGFFVLIYREIRYSPSISCVGNEYGNLPSSQMSGENTDRVEFWASQYGYIIYL